MGKYQKNTNKSPDSPPFFLLPLSFFLIEAFAFCFLSLSGQTFSEAEPWVLAFGLLWSVILGGILYLLPPKAARVIYAGTYLFVLVYAGFQTGYYILFSEMMWLSDFLYASEGIAYADMLLSYPLGWWLGLGGLIALGGGLVCRFPRWRPSQLPCAFAALLSISAVLGAWYLPEKVFAHDRNIQYALSNYGRSQSAEAAYENMFNPHRLYQVCGLYQTLGKDIYAHTIFPLTPGYLRRQEEGLTQIEAHFEARPQTRDNAMTGLLEGKHVVLVLMESIDDWMLSEHTPTLNRLMGEGINFTRFYTPVYGGIRTFNTEFAINNGSFLSSQGGYAFDYVTNHYNQSLANQLRKNGYSAKAFHYNSPSFYSRGEFAPAMGYEEYVYYRDHIQETDEKKIKNLLYDDLLLFDNPGLRQEFFRQGQLNLNFVITRSAHLSYKYNEVLSYWGLKKYPQYRGLTGNEETDCALLKARLVDDFFAGMLQALEEEGQLDNTVIIGVTDHYTYGYKDVDSLLKLSGVEDALLLEKTPCFVWSEDLPAMEVDKVLNTADLLPTVLNLLGVKSPYPYLGQDAFDDRYEGFVPFSDGGWIFGDAAYNGSKKKFLSISGQQQIITAETQNAMAEKVQTFVKINNLLLETDYYKELTIDN